MTAFSEITDSPFDRMDGTPAAVRLEHVSRVFGTFAALRDISLDLEQGASAVLLGENGAGKSTLLRVVAGLLAATHGVVQVLGERPADAAGQVAYMSHATMLYDELTGMENLEYFGRLYAAQDRAAGSLKPLKERAAESLVEVGLDPANPRRVGEYSQGMRQRAALARVLMSEPALLLLDEPFSNLDVQSAERMIARLLRFRGDDARRTLLLTTHQAELAKPLADVTIMLQGGRLASVTRREARIGERS